jgi:Ca2+-binding EF-hand superfamily protein
MRKSPSGERNNVDIIQTIRQKLLDSRIKVAQILHKCENIDKNGDGLIHTDDLEDIFNETVGSEYRITRRELLKLVGLISNERSNGKVEYEKIFDLIEPPKKKEYKKADENWKDEGVEDGDTRWATQPGNY